MSISGHEDFNTTTVQASDYERFAIKMYTYGLSKDVHMGVNATIGNN